MSDEDGTSDRPAKSSIAVLARAATSAEADEPESALPRLLRYALAALNGRPLLSARLLQEIQTLVPELTEIAEKWADEPKTYCRSLAGALDALAYERDKPPLVSVADTVLALSVTDEPDFAVEHRRVAAALAATAKAVAREVDQDIRATLDEVVLGWALVVAAIDPPINTSAAQAANFLASTRTQWIARVEAKRWQHERGAASRQEELPIEALAANETKRPAAVAAEGAVRVCDLSETELMNGNWGNSWLATST